MHMRFGFSCFICLLHQHHLWVESFMQFGFQYNLTYKILKFKLKNKKSFYHRRRERAYQQYKSVENAASILGNLLGTWLEQKKVAEKKKIVFLALGMEQKKGKSPIFNSKLSWVSDFQPRTPKPDIMHPWTNKTRQIYPLNRIHPGFQPRHPSDMDIFA